MGALAKQRPHPIKPIRSTASVLAEDNIRGPLSISEKGQYNLMYR